jgi:hypothetical protein
MIQDLQKDLTSGLKKLVIQECRMKGLVPQDLADDAPLIGSVHSGAGGSATLDSLDAVELVAALERSFGFRIDNAGDARHVMKSITSVAESVQAHAKPEQIDRFLQLSFAE